jgi:hypothetical protein
MHEDPQLDATDPGSVTERHTVPPAEGAGGPEQPMGSVPPSTEPATPVDRYTPASEPRPEWTRDPAAETAATPARSIGR